jgi:hypothetical protein
MIEGGTEMSLARWMSKDGADLSPGASVSMATGAFRSIWMLRWPLGILALVLYLIG